MRKTANICFLSVFLIFGMSTGCFSQGLNPLNPGNIFGGTVLDPQKKGLPNLDPIPHATNLAQGIVTGNQAQAREGLGGLLLNSPGCLGCAQIAQQVVPQLSPQQINRIAGTGFLTFLATGEPVLVLVSVSTAVATELRLGAPQPSPPGPPASPTPRPPQTYTATATCMVERNGEVWAGWSGAAVLTNSAQLSFTYPSVSLVAGDTLVVTSPDCGWTDPSTSQVTLLQATFRYTRVQSTPNEQPEAIKLFLVGQRDQ